MTEKKEKSEGKKQELKFSKKDIFNMANVAGQIGDKEFTEFDAKELYHDLEKFHNDEVINVDKDFPKYSGLIIKIIKIILKNSDKLVDTETLQRLQAEFENYKKRIDKEKESFRKYSNAELILKLLPIADSFEIALKNTSNKEEFVKGIELIFAQLFSLLESEGLRPIKALGEKFDPYRHEVLMQEKSDKDEGTILEELQKGYMLNDRVLRHSKVKAAKK